MPPWLLVDGARLSTHRGALPLQRRTEKPSVSKTLAQLLTEIYREWGVAIVKGRAECLLALLECTVPNASPRSKLACGKSRGKLIERAHVVHCSGGFAEAVLLRRRYAVMKEAARARRR